MTSRKTTALLTLFVGLISFSFIFVQPVASLTEEEDNQFRHHINTGNRHLAKRLYKDAIYEYEQALKIDPTSRLAKDNLALVHTNWGTEMFNRRKFGEARQHWEIALKINPNNPIARENLRTLDIHIRNAQARERHRQRMMEEYGDEEDEDDEEDYDEPPYPDARQRRRDIEQRRKAKSEHEQSDKEKTGEKEKDEKKKAEAKAKQKKPPAVVIIKKGNSQKSSNDPAISDLTLILGSDPKDNNQSNENSSTSKTPLVQSESESQSTSTNSKSSGDPFATGAHQKESTQSPNQNSKNNTNIDTMIQNSIETLENSRSQTTQPESTGNDKPVKKPVYSLNNYPGKNADDGQINKKSRKNFQVVEEKEQQLQQQQSRQPSQHKHQQLQQQQQQQQPTQQSKEPVVQKEIERPSGKKSKLTLFEKLTKLEKMVFGKTREKEPIIKRLEQLEKDTLGAKQSGPVKKRIEKLTKTYGI